MKAWRGWMGLGVLSAVPVLGIVPIACERPEADVPARATLEAPSDGADAGAEAGTVAPDADTVTVNPGQGWIGF